MSRTMTSKSILVLGSSGFLGSRLSSALSNAGHRVVKQVRGRPPQADERDIGELTKRALTEALRDLRPEVVVNLVALTDVDLCEQDLPLAYRSNVQVVADVVAAIAD